MNQQDKIESDIRRIQVCTRRNYGQIIVYPVNNDAFIFANLLKVKTFNAFQLKTIEALGYEVQQVMDPESVLPMPKTVSE